MLSRLDRRVVIEQPSTTQDATGQPLTTWALVDTLWANIRHQSGVEVLKAGADTSVVKASIMIRRHSGINAGMRVVYGSTVYQIKTVAPDEKKLYLYLVCEVSNAVS